MPKGVKKNATHSNKKFWRFINGTVATIFKSTKKKQLEFGKCIQLKYSPKECNKEYQCSGYN